MEAIAEASHAPQPPPSELRWRLLFEQSPLSIQVFAPDGRTIHFNPAWKNLFGLTHQKASAINVLQAPDLINCSAATKENSTPTSARNTPPLS